MLRVRMYPVVQPVRPGLDPSVFYTFFTFSQPNLAG